MDRQTIPGEYAVRADLVGGTGWVIGNSNQLHIEVILDLIQQSLDAFAKLLHRRRVRLIDVLQFMEQVVEFGHGRPRTSTVAPDPRRGQSSVISKRRSWISCNVTRSSSDRRQATYLFSRFDQQNKTMVNIRQTMARQNLHRTTHQRPLSATQVQQLRHITIAIRLGHAVMSRV